MGSETSNLDLTTLSDPALRADPYPLFTELREASPFSTRDEKLYVVGRHAECTRILRDPVVSSDRSRSQVRSTCPEEGELSVSFVFLDPPDHTRLRRLVSRAFTPRVVARLRPRIQQIIDELLAAADPTGFDLVSGLAHPLPVRVISELLGIPEDDHERFASWSDRRARGMDAELGSLDSATFADALAARQEFKAYFTELIETRRHQDGADLISQLIQVRENGDQLTTGELLTTCTLLLVAGHETTTNLIANGSLALLGNRDQLAALRADPSLITRTVEETLRYDPPIQFTSRIVLGSYRVGEFEAQDGATIVLLIAAANRDPVVFAEPDKFDIRRHNANQHLAFGAGIHFCLGAGLARLQAAIALETFATRFTAPQLTEVSYKANVNFRGPERLVVTSEIGISPAG
jgi:cytochrome P450